MCGFVLTQHYQNRALFEKALEKIKSRGPDFTSIQEKEKIQTFLGHNRLVIQDKSSRSHQPFEHNNYSLVFNGEIYNFIEIKEELLKSGISFSTTSDTEVVLKSFIHWGEKCLDRFNGMWAFAILNLDNGEVFAARDRFGIKPVYFFNKEFFSLASEVKSIHVLLGLDASHDIEVIEDLVKGSFKWHGTMRTYLKDVSSLPAGCVLRKIKNKVFVNRWYVFKKQKVDKNINAQAHKLKHLLIDSCRLRLRSDVPVATCLSGGVDSSGILSIIFKKINVDYLKNFSYQSFTASFPGTSLDESHLAKFVAKENNSKIEILEIVKPDIKELESVMRRFDGPVNSLAFYPIYCLYKKIKKNQIKVTLDGQGPDEILGGYYVFREAFITGLAASRYRWILGTIYAFIFHGHENIARNITKIKDILIEETPKHFLYKLKKIRHSIIFKIKRINFFFNNERKLILNQGQLRKDTHTKPFSMKGVEHNLLTDSVSYKGENTFDRSLFKQFFYQPLPGILFQYDRASMLNGVECRMPYLDHRIVEYLMSLPYDIKLRKGYTKFILRQALKGILHDKIRLRRKKIGFNAPLKEWFDGPLREWVLDIMNSNEFQQNEAFDGKKIKKAFELFLSSSEKKWDDAWKFWGYVHYAWWCRELKRDHES